MDNSSILISVIIVLCIAAGVTAYGLTNDSNTVFSDLAGFTPDASGDTGIGNNSTGNGSSSTGIETTDASSGSGTGSGTTSTSSSSGSSSGSSSSSSGSGKHNVSPERAKQLAASAARSSGWTGAYCYSAVYNSGGYYTCYLKDDAGNTGYALIGSGTGRLLEGSWSKEVTKDPDEVEDDYKENTTAPSNITE